MLHPMEKHGKIQDLWEKYGKYMGNIWEIYGDYADLLKTYMEK